MKKIICVWGLSLLAAGVLLSPAQAAPTAQVIVKQVESALKQRITSPGGTFVLKIVPGPRAAEGYFQEIYVHAKPAQIKRRRFSELVMRARNVRLAMKPLSKGKIETLASLTNLRATITENELTQALARGQDSADKNLRVKFQNDGQVRVTGNWHWGWFSGPMEATGKLRLGPNYTVVADISTLKLNGTNVPAGMKNKFQEKINPLIDYQDLPFRPPFKTLRFKDGKAFIAA